MSHKHPHQHQKQEQLSKQKLIQDKALSYNTTGVVLSALECFANRFQTDEKERTNIFSAYNNFDCGHTKTDEQLRQQIICQLTIMNVSHKLFKLEHGTYEFPKKLSQEQMIEYIKKWGSWVGDDDKKYYASAVAIIEGKDPESYVSELEGSQGKINPNWFISNVKLVYEANQVGNDAVAQYNEKGIEPDMELNSEKVGQEKINMSAGSDYQRRADQTLMDDIFDLVIKRIEEEGKGKEEKKDTSKEENEDRNTKQKDEKGDPKQGENKEEESKKEEKEETKQEEEEPKEENNQPSTNPHKCHDCCSHENHEQCSEDPEKLKQQLERRRIQTLSEMEKMSLNELIKSFGTNLQQFKSQYTFYRYKDTPSSHNEHYSKLSTYLTSHSNANNTLLEDLNIESSSQQ